MQSSMKIMKTLISTHHSIKFIRNFSRVRNSGEFDHISVIQYVFPPAILSVIIYMNICTARSPDINIILQLCGWIYGIKPGSWASIYPCK
jgi:uncharacterized membrane protein YqaE (UPF0057 family)